MDESGKVLLRQSIEREISNQMLFNSILEEGLIESVNFYLDEHNIAFFSRNGSLDPVSYTHLDVHKRQSPSLRKIGCWESI